MNFEALFSLLQTDKRIPLAFAGIMALLSLSAVWDSCAMFSQPAAPAYGSSSAVAPAVQAGPSIASLHLFGQYDAAPTTVPKTQLQLTLEGIEATVNQNGTSAASRALIASPSGPVKVYKVGDSLPGDAVIKRILKSEVIISHNGSLESIKLPVPKLNNA